MADTMPVLIEVILTPSIIYKQNHIHSTHTTGNKSMKALTLSILTAILQVDLGRPVPDGLHSGFYWS